MMNQYKGTQTEQNLTEAYAIESKARNKYTFFATTAQREGYEQIADLFLKTADNEREHAEMWFSELGGIADTVRLDSHSGSVLLLQLTYLHHRAEYSST